MGADIYIKTKYKPRFKGVDERFIVKTYDDYYYYRDNYNITALAWVVGLSYFNDFVDDPIEFINKLARISDDQIRKYVSTHALPDEFEQYLKAKRNYIKSLVEAEISDMQFTV